MNNYKEPIVSVELAKLLPSKGYDVITEKTWGTCPSYKGEVLDLDDEIELHDEGVPDSEIVDMDVLYDSWWFPKHNENTYPAPTHGLLNEWLIERWNVCILVVPYITTEGVMWCCECKRLHNDMVEPLFDKAGFSERSECFEYGVSKALEEII
jgi:hypothetical protein